MTENATSLFKKGIRCRICTGCGRCFGEKKIDAVSSFTLGADSKKPKGILHVLLENDGQDAEGAAKQDENNRQNALQDSANATIITADTCMVAVDIGTTTIAMQLRNMADGSILDTYTCLNPQRSYGADVLSRIEAAEKPEAKKAMQEAVQGALREGLIQFEYMLCSQTDKTAGALSTQEFPHIHHLSIAANTTMVHLLMGYDVSRLGRYPFVAETLSEIYTRLFGIDTVILPGISAFVGGDIVAGMEALSMQERKEVTLLLDLGTNGEMVLGNKDRLVAAATAAGPAFEGNSDCYGTDLMYLTAQLVKEGILDTTGLLADSYFEEGITIGGVLLTQQYIRQLQMAKAAICTGIGILCEKYGLQDFAEIDKVFLAGGMGYYLDPKAAATIGLFPQVLADKTVAVGNAALEGAFVYGRRVFCGEMLGQPSASKPVSGVAEAGSDINNCADVKAEVYNLAEEPDFSEKYIANMELVSFT